MGMYAGRTESAHSAEMKGKHLNRHKFGEQLQDGCHTHICRKEYKRWCDTCRKLKESFLIIVIKIVKKYATHPTPFTTMLHSNTSNNFHDLFWQQEKHNYMMHNIE
jgi:hypothetical protein